MSVRWRVCASLRVVVRAHCYARGRVRVRVSAGLACGCVCGGAARVGASPLQVVGCGVCPRVLLRGGVAVFFASLRVRGRACGCVSACVLVWRARVWLGGRACVRGPPPGGVLWRFPTLPHPLGCSTIGAAGLSFQVRNVAGRFPGAVTTTSLCRPPPLLLARRVAGCPGPPCGGLGGGWVGRGSYSGCGSSVPPLVAVVWPVFVGPAGVGGVWLPVPPLLAPFLVCGAGGPWPSLVAVLAVWGVGAGLGGVGVVSAH